MQDIEETPYCFHPGPHLLPEKVKLLACTLTHLQWDQKYEKRKYDPGESRRKLTQKQKENKPQTKTYSPDDHYIMLKCQPF